jgi:hypothetical protein
VAKSRLGWEDQFIRIFCEWGANGESELGEGGMWDGRRNILALGGHTKDPKGRGNWPICAWGAMANWRSWHFELGWGSTIQFGFIILNIGTIPGGKIEKNMYIFVMGMIVWVMEN